MRHTTMRHARLSIVTSPGMKFSPRQMRQEPAQKQVKAETKATEAPLCGASSIDTSDIIIAIATHLQLRTLKTLLDCVSVRDGLQRCHGAFGIPSLEVPTPLLWNYKGTEGCSGKLGNSSQIPCGTCMLHSVVYIWLHVTDGKMSSATALQSQATGGHRAPTLGPSFGALAEAWTQHSNLNR